MWRRVAPARLARDETGLSALVTHVRALDDGRAEVEFDTPQQAITPGQAVVWYDGDEVIGATSIDWRAGFRST